MSFLTTNEDQVLTIPAPGLLAGHDTAPAPIEGRIVAPSDRPLFMNLRPATGNGTTERPWNLEQALLSKDVRPGETIWLRGGRYRVWRGLSALRGTPEQSVTIRSYPGEWAVIDTFTDNNKANPAQADIGVLYDKGAYTVWRDLEICCTAPRPRETTYPGSYPRDRGRISRGTLGLYGDGTWIINCIVHDLDNGLGHQVRDSFGGGVYGCVIYSCGWKGPDRWHGHGAYYQHKSASGIPRVLEDNIVFGNHGDGIVCYGDDAFLEHLHILGNFCFENGLRDVLLGGAPPVKGGRVEDNVAWNSALQSIFDVGYYGRTNPNLDTTIKNNLVGGVLRCQRPWSKLVCTGNTVISPGRANALVEWYRPPAGSDNVWDDNVYYTALPSGFGVSNQFMSFNQWKATTGFDTRSQLHRLPSDEVFIRIRPNRFSPGRAHIAVLSFGGDRQVTVDVSSVVRPGAVFSVHSAYDPLGTPVASGVYGGGAIVIPLGTVAPPTPIGATKPLATRDIRFGAFILRSESQRESLTITSSDSRSRYGADVSVAADGSFTYDPRQSDAIQRLSAGVVLEDSFDYSIGTARHNAKVVVTGLDEPAPPPPPPPPDSGIRDLLMDAKEQLSAVGRTIDDALARVPANQ